MMESCLAWRPERGFQEEVEDIKRNLLGEFTALQAQDSVLTHTENLQVFLRVRPFTLHENKESQDCVSIEGHDSVVLRPPSSCQSSRQGEKPLPQTVQRFSFTQVFGPEASQRKVFQGSVRGLVREVLQGGNSLVFTYGVTNAGKTFTFLGPDHDSGLLPRSLLVIFNSIEDRLYGLADLKPQRCRDFSKLTLDQQAAEISSKKNLLRLLKESDKTLTAGTSAFLEGSSLSSVDSAPEDDSFCLDVSSNIRFSVWVSFCEIYNENIYDLLEQVPSGQHKRTTLRLSQDIKGNSFIKDLRWVQVNSSEEAFRVMKIGKKNQSCFSTRLNQLSSRSHSIFSIRILRINDVGVPKVLGISELALCDLAGSERCSRTRNTGVRLKEAGNINSSLLTLGKCINAMRLNQNAKFQHHIPFRESKLTHFLQFFFCGAGRVSMVVNINQNPSFFDETLNVLKFSALAQKVVVMNSLPTVLDEGPHKSAMDLSIIVDEAEQHRNALRQGRKSSLVAWETSLEDVQEEEEEEEEESVMERTVLEAEGEDKEDQTMEEEATVSLQQQNLIPSAAGDQKRSDGWRSSQSGREAALRLVLEAQIREEVGAEFMKLFNKMEQDYSERLEKEREILEERADRRVEILKNLIDQPRDLSAISTNRNQEEQTGLEGMISFITEDLQKIREDAQSVHQCLTGQAHNVLLEEETWKLQEEINKKEELINELREREVVRRGLQEELRGRERELRGREEELREREEELRGREEELRGREEELKRLVEEVEQLKKENMLLEKNVQTLTDLDNCLTCASVLSSLEVEQKETSRLQKENKALVNGIFQLQKEVSDLQAELNQQTNRHNSLSEQLSSSKSRLLNLENQLEEKCFSMRSLTEEVDHLKQEVKNKEGRSLNSSSVFHAAMEELKKERQTALQRSAQKSEQISELRSSMTRLEEALAHSQNMCEELTNQRAELTQQLQNLRVELESEGGALRIRLEEVERERSCEVSELSGIVSQKEKLLEDSRQLADILRQEMQHLKKQLLMSEEKENHVVKKRRVRRLRGKEESYTKGDAQDLSASPLMSRRVPKLLSRKRSSSELEGVVFSEKKKKKKKNKENRQDQEDGGLQSIEELIWNSPSGLSSQAKTNPPQVRECCTKEEAVTVVTKPRRGKKKLVSVSSLLLDSPYTTCEGVEEDKESDHLIIKRQLRSKTCRK